MTINLGDVFFVICVKLPLKLYNLQCYITPPADSHCSSWKENVHSCLSNNIYFMTYSDQALFVLCNKPDKSVINT